MTRLKTTVNISDNTTNPINVNPLCCLDKVCELVDTRLT